jgi:hypothetical protein
MAHAHASGTQVLVCQWHPHAVLSCVGTGEGHSTINILPDNVLLEVFAFCLSGYTDSIPHMMEWQRLVQVSQRWRQIIYASPRYLKLSLCCSKGTPVRYLACWPEFPITMSYHLPPLDCSDVIALLKHCHRVCVVDLVLTISQFETVAAEMRGPFPVLTQFEVDVLMTGRQPIIPPGFLGESAPFLRRFYISGIRFPRFPRFFLSCRDNLLSLRLDRIPGTEISPEAMAAGLSVLTRLISLYINFLYPGFLAEERTRPESPVRAVLPALTKFEFGGQREYIEDFIALLDAPRLDVFRMNFDPLRSLRLPQLSLFIARTENLRFSHAQVTFNDCDVDIKLDRSVRSYGDRIPSPHHLSLATSFIWPGPHVEHVSHVLSQLFAMFPDLGYLFVRASEDHRCWRDDVDSTQLLAFLHLFTTVEMLHVSGRLAGQVAHALADVPEEMVTEVLPSLHQLFFEDDDGCVESTERFASSRQLYGHPVIVVDLAET